MNGKSCTIRDAPGSVVLGQPPDTLNQPLGSILTVAALARLGFSSSWHIPQPGRDPWAEVNVQ
jgi:hypothetical protein